ncbi:MAG: hypothetical protein MJ204_05765 [Bacteroidales bacterium]|nr:hypothetical protein [Bacteroidales bacterium]
MKKRLTISPILKTLFVIFILIGNVSFSGIAQQKRLTEKEKQEKIDSLINNSDVIVEGRITDKLLTFVDDKNEVYSVFKLNIYRTLKGNDLGEHIYILYRMYSLLFDDSNKNSESYFKDNRDCIFDKDLIQFDVGLFLLKDNCITINSNSQDNFITNHIEFHTKNNSIPSNIYIPMNINSIGIGEITEIEDNIIYQYKGPAGLKFKSLWEVYSYLLKDNSKITNENISLPNNGEILDSLKKR